MSPNANDRAASTADPEKLVAEFRSSTKRWLFGSFAGWGTFVLCFVGIGLVIIAVRWWQNIGTFYQLTDQRLVIRRGVIVKTEDEVELYRVKDVRVTYSILNQITDIGEITLVSTDLSTRAGPLVLRSIPDARNIREDIRDLVNKARFKARVRELDLDVE